MRSPGLRFGTTLAPALLVALAGVPAAEAQFQVGATFGVDMPTRDRLFQEYGGVNGSPVAYPVNERWRVGSGVMQGRVVRWMNHIGVEGTLGISLGNMNTRDSTNRVKESASHTIMASVRMPVRLTKRTSSLLVHASVGLGYLHYGGPAWVGYQNLGHPAAVVALGARGRMGRRSRWWFRVEVEDWMARSSFGQAGVLYGTQFYHSTTFGFGAVYQVGSRR
ncbi:MAG: hypothetical protein EXR93_09900 [Gemmatimonadetes bacterium]|nr:hypothetical protein [Gemmatimonadota bacterium]